MPSCSYTVASRALARRRRSLGWKAPHTPRQVGGNANNGRNPLSSNLFYFLELISAQSSPRELITSSIRILCGNHQGFLHVPNEALQDAARTRLACNRGSASKARSSFPSGDP